VPIKVVDASAVAAVLFVEPGADTVAGRIEGFELACPTLLPYEVASVCGKKIRRQPNLRRELLRSLLNLARMGITEHAVPPTDAVDLAQRLELTPHDAAYVWVARFLDAELVTLDRKLDRACRSAGR
jgi:predicted nucleic acid-binding protein